MRNPDRIPATLKELEEFWNEHPDLRLGQLILTVAMTGEHNQKLFYMEDDEFLKLLTERRAQLKK